MTTRRDGSQEEQFEPMRTRTPRNRLGDNRGRDVSGDLSHDELLECLKAIDGLEVGRGAQISFVFRSKPFLHFHDHDGLIHADVKFGSGDFEAVPASTPAERRALLDRVELHVRKIHRARKGDKRPRR